MLIQNGIISAFVLGLGNRFTSSSHISKQTTTKKEDHKLTHNNSLLCQRLFMPRIIM